MDDIITKIDDLEKWLEERFEETNIFEDILYGGLLTKLYDIKWDLQVFKETIALYHR